MKYVKHLKNGLHWYHWLVVFSSLLLTFIAWYVSDIQVQEKLKQRFEFQSEQLLALISERMSRYEDALRSGAATIRSQNNEINVNEWHRFSETLNLDRTYPGINGIGVIYYVSKEELPDFLSEQRRLRPDFKIKPLHKENEFWPITYVEPIYTNKQAIGLDMAFESNRFEAAKLARDTGKTKITAPIILVQDAKKTPGFLQYVPFYKEQDLNNIQSMEERFIGHVYAPFIMEKLIAGTLEKKNRLLLFSVYDNDDDLYNELSSSTEELDIDPLFQKTVTIDMYGRPWHFTIQTALSFRESASTNQPLYILAGGLVIDTMLVLLFFMLSNSHKRALKLAKNMTRKLSLSENYYRHIIDSAPCGIIIVDTQGKIEKLNPQIEKLFGYKKNELIGRLVDILVPIRSQTIHARYRGQFVDNPKPRKMGIGKEIYCLTKSQKEFPAEIGLAHFLSDGNSKVIATVIDMTEQSEITCELKRSNKELDEFAYIASHDLKAPLRGIIQLSSWIEEDVIETANDDTKENLILLKNRTMRLDKLLDDLLAYSRVGRKQGEIRQVNIREVVTETFDLLDPPSGLKLVCEKNMPVFETYSTPLETVFRNLIGNAIKHHDKSKGLVEVQFLELADAYEFSISDNGPGIPSQHHEKIFDLFKTLKPRDEVEGSGMGLSIVKKIIEYQGQTIDVVSDGKSGTLFRFRWPKTVK